MKPANPNTAAQQTQRGKMASCVAFAKSLVGPVFNAYTDKFQKSMSGFNYFIKQNIAEFDGSVDYSALKVTEGKLYPLQSLLANYDHTDGGLVITWDEAIGNNGALTDAVYWALHDTDSGLWYFADAEVTRDDEGDSQTIPLSLTYSDLELYAWAVQMSGTLVSLISDSAHATCTEGP